MASDRNYLKVSKSVMKINNIIHFPVKVCYGSLMINLDNMYVKVNFSTLLIYVTGIIEVVMALFMLFFHLFCLFKVLAIN